jgi:hypothetical protein
MAHSRTGPPPTNHRPVDLLLDALLDQVLAPVEEAVPTMRRAVAAFRTATSPWWMELACLMALDLGDDESAEVLSARQVELAREQGAFAVLSQALRVHAITRTVFGRYEEAAASLEEARAIDEAAGTVSLSFAELVLAGWRGDADRVGELRATMRRRIGRDEAVGELYATAVLRNGLADYAAALETGLASRKQEQEGSYVVWGLDQEFVEAAVRAGRPEECAAAMARLEALAPTGRTAWAEARYRLAQALLDPTAESTDARYREAIDLFARTEARAYYGRTRLMYGEWLRRAGRRAEARVELQAAHETLTAAGVTAFAERAARERRGTVAVAESDAGQLGDAVVGARDVRVGRHRQGARAGEQAAVPPRALRLSRTGQSPAGLIRNGCPGMSKSFNRNA